MLKFEFKITFLYFFNTKGIIHFEFVTEGTTVDHTFYVEVLKKLTDAMRYN
jgi:hypothetical protein